MSTVVVIITLFINKHNLCIVQFVNVFNISRLTIIVMIKFNYNFIWLYVYS